MEGDVKYILFDGRYWDDPDSASMIYVTNTLGEATRMQKKNYPDSVVVSAIERNGKYECQAPLAT